MKYPKHLRDNILASLVLFLIAIPLNLGIALASGVSATAGLVSGIVGGLIVGPLAGCSLMVSGPATGLIAMIWQITEKHGLASLGVVALGAGFLQIGIGFFRLGPWFRAVSPAVIQGMLAGIGVLIFASQFHVMLSSQPQDSGWKNLVSLPGVLVRLLAGGQFAAYSAASLGLMTILITGLWPLLKGRARLIPGSLPAVGLAVFLAWAFKLPVQYVNLPDSLLSELNPLTPTQLWSLTDSALWGSILALTFIATAQTLLTATAVDRLHEGPRTDYDREVMAQGLGNAVCGLLGTLPVAGVIVRSAAGIQAGSKGRSSSAFQGLWLLIFVFCFAPALRLIPIASLAAILVYTGLRLVNLDAARGLGKFGRAEQWIYLATLGSVVATDLLTGIVVGFALSAVRLLYILTHCQCEVRTDPARGLIVVELSGSATFFTLPSLTRTLESLPPRKEVHLFVSHLDYIDHACLEYVLGWEEQYMKAGGQAYIEWDRLVRRFQRASEERAAPDALLLGQDYDSVVARGVFLDLEEADNWRGMVGQIAEALASRTNQASVLQQRLTFKIEEGGGSFSLGALVMGLRLPDFRRHEMVVVRCPHGLVVPDPVAGTSQTVYCFILLVGSQERPDEHLKMLASLIARVAEDRAEAWHSAASSDDMRRKLLQHQRFVNITLTKGQPSEAFIRQAVWQLSAILPADVLIVSVERDGESIVPKGGTTLLEGDTITVLGKPGQVESLFAEYVMTSHQSSLQVALSP